MHPRERVLEELRRHKENDLAIPSDLAALAVRLVLFLSVYDVRHPITKSDKEQGETKNGTSIFRDLQR